MTTPSLANVIWRPGFRIVSSRFPPVGLFDDIADPDDLEALYELEGMTNPHLRDELGEIQLVPRERRIVGPGTTPVMAAFTHPNPQGSRFSDGQHGVCYIARERATAIAETVYHRQRFLAATQEPAIVLEMRCYLLDLDARLHDLRGGWPEAHAPDNYAAGQALASTLRQAGSDGLVYDSVRNPSGQCAAPFYPDCLGPARQGPHFFYHWNGLRISHAVVASEVLPLAIS